MFAALALALLAFQASPRELLEDGRRLQKQGKLEEALKSFDRALELEPRLVPALASRSGLRMKLGDEEGAARDLDLLVELVPADARLREMRGVLRLRRDPASALLDFNKALELDPDSTDALEKRGICKLKLQDPGGALRDFDRAIELGSAAEDKRSFRGICLALTARPRNALYDLSVSIEQDGTNKAALAFRAWCYALISAPDHALRDVKVLTELDPDHDGNMDLTAWLARSRAGVRADADQALIAALERTKAGPDTKALGSILLGRPLPKDVPDLAEDPDWECRVKFWTGMKRLHEGEREAALVLLDEAARAERPMLLEAAASRYLKTELRYAARRDRLSALERRWHSFKTLHAEFEATRPLDAGEREEDARVRMTFDFDLLGKRLYLRIERAQEGDIESYIGPDYVYYVWGSREEAHAIDWGPFYRLSQDQDIQARKSLDAVFGRPLRSDPTPLSCAFRLSVGAKTAPAGTGSLNFAFGWGTQGKSSWAEEVAASPTAELEEEAGDLVCRLPGRRTLRIDLNSGFLRSIEVADPDGRIRSLRRTSFSVDAPFKAVELPLKFKRTAIPLGELGSVMGGIDGLLGEQLIAVADGWPDITRVARETDAYALLTETAARRLAAWLEVSHRSMVRSVLKSAVEKGMTMDALVENRVKLAREMEIRLKDDERWRARLGDNHEEAVEEALRAALEKPVSLQARGVVFLLSRRGLDVDRVLEALPRVAPGQLERIVREEIDALRQL